MTMSNPVYAVVIDSQFINMYIFCIEIIFFKGRNKNIQFSAICKLKGYNSVIKIPNKQSLNQLKHKINKYNVNYQKY